MWLFAIGSVSASAYLLLASLASFVAEVSGSQAIGALSGLAGASFLGAVGVQVMRTYRSSLRWQEGQLTRQLAEIERLGNESITLRRELEEERDRLYRERERAHALSNQLKLLHVQSQEVTDAASGTAAKKAAEVTDRLGQVAQELKPDDD